MVKLVIHELTNFFKPCYPLIEEYIPINEVLKNTTFHTQLGVHLWQQDNATCKGIVGDKGNPHPHKNGNIVVILMDIDQGQTVNESNNMYRDR